ncbi:hypothetical protein ACVWWG_007638 [Bradyrhizobium sp. LB7.2]
MSDHHKQCSAGNEREALRPFAAVAAVDIGSDEADGDLFSPINDHNAPRLTVGDFRRALAALSSPAKWQPSAGNVDDPTASKEWNEGCDFAMEQLCRFLGVDPSSVSWDAATETVDGDVQAVIGNILRAKFGEDWGPNDRPQAAAAAGKRGMIRDHKLALLKGWIDDPSDARAVECAKGVTDAIVLLERHGIIDWVTEPQAAEVSDKELLNWIENEASRGLTEGDAREALTAIKWKIKDGR